MKIFATILVALLTTAMVTNARAADKLQHVVCFKFKSTATAQDITKVEEAFRALKKEIPLIKALRVGHQCQPGEEGQGVHALLHSRVQEREGPRRLHCSS